MRLEPVACDDKVRAGRYHGRRRYRPANAPADRQRQSGAGATRHHLRGYVLWCTGSRLEIGQFHTHVACSQNVCTGEVCLIARNRSRARHILDGGRLAGFDQQIRRRDTFQSGRLHNRRPAQLLLDEILGKQEYRDVHGSVYRARHFGIARGRACGCTDKQRVATELFGGGRRLCRRACGVLLRIDEQPQRRAPGPAVTLQPVPHGRVQ